MIFSKKYRFLRQSIFDKKSKAIGLGKSSKFLENFFFLKQVYILQHDKKELKLNLVWEEEWFFQKNNDFLDGQFLLKKDRL